MTSKSFLIGLILSLIDITYIYPQKYNAEVINYSTSVEVLSNYRLLSDSVTIQINNRAGDPFSSINIPFSAGDKVSCMKAWIEKMDGTKVKSIKKNDMIDISSASNGSLFEDHYVKCFKLQHNEYPYRIKYTYKIENPDLLTIVWWNPIINNNIPTNQAKLTVVYSKNIPVIINKNNISDSTKITKNDKITLIYYTKYDQPFPQEIFAQSLNFIPVVKISPLCFNYGMKGCYTSWQTYGNWYYRLCQGLDVLPNYEKNAITSLIQGVTDKKEIIRILYHYFQDHTRYINVTIGIGALKPFPATYVAQNKYGDCKALTNYLKAILKFAGIESFLVLVNADEQPSHLKKEFVGPQFNHVILAVPNQTDTIWLENTSNIMPFGYVGVFTQNREALIISKENSHIVRIPALTKENNRETCLMELYFTLKGQANAKFCYTFKGKSFEMFNQLHSEYNDNVKNKIIHEFSSWENSEVVDWNLQKLHRDTAQISFFCNLNINNSLTPLGNEYYFSLFPIGVPSFSKPENRILPVELPFPIYKIDTLIYHFPEGYDLKINPDSVLLTSKYGKYEITFSRSKSQLCSIKKFELFAGTIPINHYPDFYEFINRIKDVDTKKIIIHPVQ